MKVLNSLNTLEQEIYERYKEGFDEDSLWDEYAQACNDIIEPISVKPYTDTRSFGEPTKYEYLNNPATEVTVIIKSENRAVIETCFEHGIMKKNQFILKKVDNEWKIDSVKYGFPEESKWMKDEI